MATEYGYDIEVDLQNDRVYGTSGNPAYIH